MSDTLAEASTEDLLRELARYGESHARLHTVIRALAARGIGPVAIARTSGLTRQGVAKIIRRTK